MQTISHLPTIRGAGTSGDWKGAAGVAHVRALAYVRAGAPRARRGAEKKRMEEGGEREEKRGSAAVPTTLGRPRLCAGGRLTGGGGVALFSLAESVGAGAERPGLRAAALGAG